MKVLRDSRVIEEYAPERPDTGARILQAIRSAERCGDVPSIRELQKTCGISSTSVVRHHLRNLVRDGDLTLRQRGTARGYKLTEQGRGYASDAELLAQLQEKHDADQAAFRHIRRWIESEDRPGERTAEVYALAGKALDY